MCMSYKSSKLKISFFFNSPEVNWIIISLDSSSHLIGFCDVSSYLRLHYEVREIVRIKKIRNIFVKKVLIVIMLTTKYSM